MATQANGTGKEVATRAAALADEALTAARALVDGPRCHGPSALELLAQALQVGQDKGLAELIVLKKRQLGDDVGSVRRLVWVGESYRDYAHRP